MKVLLIVTRADTVAGAQVYVRELAIALQSDGHDVLVMTGQAGPYNQDLAEHSIPFQACDAFKRSISLLRDRQTYHYIVELLQTFQPDIVSASSSKAGVLARLACRTQKIPCVFTAHGWAFADGVSEPSRILYRLIEKFMAPLATRIICVSERDRQLGLKAGISAQKLVTVHNGMTDVAANLRSQPALDPPRLVMVARFDKQKDHQTLLAAVRKVSNLQVDLVGDGPNLPAMRSWCAEQGLQDRVKFYGFRRDIPERLANAQLFALISNWEGFPLAIVEAMRAGLPVLASRVGGVEEAVFEEETGYLIEPHDMSTLALRLQQLVDDPSLRQRLGDNARQRYEQEFTFQQMYRQTLGVWQAARQESSTS
ncbi:MAG: glycosyltransferase family 4 protein [Cyanobacteria bacterium P01_H01_bin.15]